MDNKERDKLERDFGLCLEEGSYFYTVDRFCDFVKDACKDIKDVPDMDKSNHLAECLARNKIEPWMLEFIACLLDSKINPC